ncbi:threonine ammonia-lyase, biosynthetic [Planctomicrobium sp. SH668]|uniref:threonine ammonia-lyase, biosynthetic n=1 Tax=Planctomicrobium sp. SH668 TaxID=3448126 RepID=UPI003F5BADEA
MQDYIRKILEARVYDVSIESPLDALPRLSTRLGVDVRLKREDLQPIFSFKIRGAYNKIARLTAEECQRGVICASAGNHAQGVALAGRKLNIATTIVMPRTTPEIKVASVRNLGGRVILHGESFDDAYSYARKLEVEGNLTFIHPYDDPDVIAGQGTIGMEILRQHPGKIAAIFVPVGGGGLAAGLAIYTKFLRPEIKVIGVEPEDAASMAAAIERNERVVLDQVGLFADGVAVRQAGAETFRICKELLDGVITVTSDEICAAVKDIFVDTRAIAETAGAVSLAGLKNYVEEHGKSHEGALIAINSGSNMNFDRLRHIAERAELGENREALLAVTIPETPGSYRALIRLLGGRAITEFNYRYTDPKNARVFIGVHINEGEDEKKKIITRLSDAGFSVLDMSHNELAKLHIRYMVGGKAPGLRDEVIFRFQFPERPGALMKFLSSLSTDWNISLFHYRNHGADYGRVLTGIQIPPNERELLHERLKALGYPYWDESENTAYWSFLSPDHSNESGFTTANSKSPADH